jgi:hypothetical protein
MSSTNGHGPKRAILYARVSTDEQARSGYSLAQQIEALREYSAREGYEILEEVKDAGQSGASLERPGMDRVRDLVAAGGGVCSAGAGPGPLRPPIIICSGASSRSMGRRSAPSTTGETIPRRASLPTVSSTNWRSLSVRRQRNEPDGVSSGRSEK